MSSLRLQHTYSKLQCLLWKTEQRKVPGGWRSFVFDSNISQSHRKSAAQYFYEGFLGCVLPEDGAYETSRFFRYYQRVRSKIQPVRSDKAQDG